MTTQRWSRRKFIASGLAGVALGTAAHWGLRRPLRLGLIGAGGQGTGLLKSNRIAWWLGGPCADVVAVCDVDRGHREAVRAAHCPGADLYDDYARVLERDDLHAVLIATPDHWHARIAVQALHAGKAVYCEKPVSLTIAEGQAMVRAVQSTGGVFMAGTQQRSDYRFRTAAELVRNGRLGTLHTVTVTLPQRWKAEYDGPFPACPVPPELNWERWLGQAPWAEYCPQRCHGTFRRWYEYAGGTMTDWGAHHVDVVQWAMGVDQSGPEAVQGSGVMPHAANGFSTPIEFSAELRYANGAYVQVRTDPDPEATGIRFEGDRGWLFVTRGRWEGSAVDELAKRPLPADAVRLHAIPARRNNQSSYHLMHFYHCVHTGEQPVSDVVSQHRSASACHLVNLALRLGRPLRWDPAREQFIDDAGANAMLARTARSGYEVEA